MPDIIKSQTLKRGRSCAKHLAKIFKLHILVILSKQLNKLKKVWGIYFDNFAKFYCSQNKIENWDLFTLKHTLNAFDKVRVEFWQNIIHTYITSRSRNGDNALWSLIYDCILRSYFSEQHSELGYILSECIANSYINGIFSHLASPNNNNGNGATEIIHILYPYFRQQIKSIYLIEVKCAVATQKANRFVLCTCLITINYLFDFFIMPHELIHKRPVSQQ